MTYLEMTQHECRTVLQPCFNVSMLPKPQHDNDGYVCQQLDEITVWSCLVDRGEMSAGQVAEFFGAKLRTVCRRLAIMRREGNVTLRMEAHTKYYTATARRPPVPPVYAVRSALIRHAVLTTKQICELTHLSINQVRDAITLLREEDLLNESAAKPIIFSLKGTA